VNDLITPQDIHEQEFKSAFRGYDKDEVDAFLQAVADSYQAVLAESINLKDRLAQLDSQLRQAASQVAPAVAGAVTAATSTADKSVAELLSYVKEISAQIIESARRQADLLLQEAALKARMGTGQPPQPPPFAR
jgi:cell division initiation protein